MSSSFGSPASDCRPQEQDHPLSPVPGFSPPAILEMHKWYLHAHFVAFPALDYVADSSLIWVWVLLYPFRYRVWF